MRFNYKMIYILRNNHTLWSSLGDILVIKVASVLAFLDDCIISRCQNYLNFTITLFVRKQQSWNLLICPFVQSKVGTFICSFIVPYFHTLQVIVHVFSNTKCVLSLNILYFTLGRAALTDCLSTSALSCGKVPGVAGLDSDER